MFGTLALICAACSACRAGYAPTDYPSEAEWAARAMIENSNAAKCPTVAYQLAGEQRHAVVHRSHLYWGHRVHFPMGSVFYFRMSAWLKQIISSILVFSSIN
eukprot:1157916-Pelagomonas_calceolata.AAC.7